MGLLDVHTQMLKEAAEKEEQTKLAEERVLVIEKYASTAKALMAEHYPNNHTDEDVVELTERMINHDLVVEEQQEKIAELDEAGRIMARAFVDELNSGK
jgi:helix-turn-helix protein